MSDNIREKFALISVWDKGMDELYHQIAVQCGLSDSAFWILYSICETDKILTQNVLTELLSLSKQTINSAIANLCRDGYIILEQIPSSKNSKSIQLTEKGKNLCNEKIFPVMQTEEKAYEDFTDEEIQTFISLYEKQYKCLKKELSQHIRDLKESKNE